MADHNIKSDEITKKLLLISKQKEVWRLDEVRHHKTCLHIPSIQYLNELLKLRVTLGLCNHQEAASNPGACFPAGHTHTQIGFMLKCRILDEQYKLEFSAQFRVSNLDKEIAKREMSGLIKQTIRAALILALNKGKSIHQSVQIIEHQQCSTCFCALSPPSGCQWGSGSLGPAFSSRPAASSKPPRPSCPDKSSPLQIANKAGASSEPRCTEVQERCPKPAEKQREGLWWRRRWWDRPWGNFWGDYRTVWKSWDSCWGLFLSPPPVFYEA